MCRSVTLCREVPGPWRGVFLCYCCNNNGSEIGDQATDLILVALLGMLLATLLAFFLGITPYPYGLLILAALIAARILFIQGRDKAGR